MLAVVNKGYGLGQAKFISALRDGLGYHNVEMGFHSALVSCLNSYTVSIIKGIYSHACLPLSSHDLTANCEMRKPISTIFPDFSTIPRSSPNPNALRSQLHATLAFYGIGPCLVGYSSDLGDPIFSALGRPIPRLAGKPARRIL
jgi:hypothetical protein